MESRLIQPAADDEVLETRRRKGHLCGVGGGACNISRMHHFSFSSSDDDESKLRDPCFAACATHSMSDVAFTRKQWQRLICGLPFSTLANLTNT